MNDLLRQTRAQSFAAGQNQNLSGRFRAPQSGEAVELGEVWGSASAVE